jgi:hypothetical protein
MSDTTSKFRTVAMFVIFNLLAISTSSQFVGMFLMYLYVKCHMPRRSSGSLTIAVKLKVKKIVSRQPFYFMHFLRFVKWRYCRAHITCSRVRHVIITDSRKLKSTTLE